MAEEMVRAPSRVLSQSDERKALFLRAETELRARRNPDFESYFSEQVTADFEAILRLAQSTPSAELIKLGGAAVKYETCQPVDHRIMKRQLLEAARTFAQSVEEKTDA